MIKMHDKDKLRLRQIHIYFRVDENEREVPLFIVNGSDYSSASDLASDLKEAWLFLEGSGSSFVSETRPIWDLSMFQKLPSWTEYRKTLGKDRT